MTLGTILRYQLGQATAIREVAANRAGLWIGGILVLTAAVARHNDQTFILEKPYWPISPLFFSFFSSLFLYSFIYPLCLRQPVEEGKDHPGFGVQYPPFLALFWMTAPLAWLYALPVERFLSSGPATLANLGLLGLVAGWRVWLLTRVLHVLTEIPFGRLLSVVLLPACFEWFALSVAGVFSLVDIMGSLTHSPEEKVLGNAAVTSFWASIVLGLVALVDVIASKKTKTFSPLSTPKSYAFRARPLAFLLACWVGAAIWTQIELSRSYHLERLVKAERYADALKFLSAHQPKDFSPSRRLFPDPYRAEVFDHLDGLFKAMDGKESSWVRTTYLAHLEIMFGHPSFAYARGRNPAGLLLNIAHALERLPEGRGWVEAHRAVLTKAASLTYDNRDQAESEAMRRQMRKLGVPVEADQKSGRDP